MSDRADAKEVDAVTSPPFACCPTDGEPLVFTFERPGYEFLCMVCGRRLGYLEPGAGDGTPERQARLDELTARFRAGERP